MITETQAIRECKKLWAEVAESGLSKGEFLDTESGEKWVKKGYVVACPLCQYVKNTLGWDDLSGRCPGCPLVKQFERGCFSLKYDIGPQGLNFWVQKFRIPKGKKPSPQPE